MLENNPWRDTTTTVASINSNMQRPSDRESILRYGDKLRDTDHQEAFRLMMTHRLQKVGLLENEYEELIRSPKDHILSSLDDSSLKALLIILEKGDFIDNYDFTASEYDILEKRLSINLLKQRLIDSDPKTRSLNFHLEQMVVNLHKVGSVLEKNPSMPSENKYIESTTGILKVEQSPVVIRASRVPNSQNFHHPLQTPVSFSKDRMQINRNFDDRSLFPQQALENGNNNSFIQRRGQGTSSQQQHNQQQDRQYRYLNEINNPFQNRGQSSGQVTTPQKDHPLPHKLFYDSPLPQSPKNPYDSPKNEIQRTLKEQSAPRKQSHFTPSSMRPNNYSSPPKQPNNITNSPSPLSPVNYQSFISFGGDKQHVQLNMLNSNVRTPFQDSILKNQTPQMAPITRIVEMDNPNSHLIIKQYSDNKRRLVYPSSIQQTKNTSIKTDFRDHNSSNYRAGNTQQRVPTQNLEVKRPLEVYQARQTQRIINVQQRSQSTPIYKNRPQKISQTPEVQQKDRNINQTIGQLVEKTPQKKKQFPKKVQVRTTKYQITSSPRSVSTPATPLRNSKGPKKQEQQLVSFRKIRIDTREEYSPQSLPRRYLSTPKTDSIMKVERTPAHLEYSPLPSFQQEASVHNYQSLNTQASIDPRIQQLSSLKEEYISQVQGQQNLEGQQSFAPQYRDNTPVKEEVEFNTSTSNKYKQVLGSSSKKTAVSTLNNLGPAKLTTPESKWNRRTIEHTMFGRSTSSKKFVTRLGESLNQNGQAPSTQLLVTNLNQGEEEAVYSAGSHNHPNVSSRLFYPSNSSYKKEYCSPENSNNKQRSPSIEARMVRKVQASPQSQHNYRRTSASYSPIRNPNLSQTSFWKNEGRKNGQPSYKVNYLVELSQQKKPNSPRVPFLNNSGNSSPIKFDNGASRSNNIDKTSFVNLSSPTKDENVVLGSDTAFDSMMMTNFNEQRSSEGYINHEPY